ncbi:MAG: DUF1146 domain-containing protein [Bacilli bacterium]|nr:DUF1146 domain-containing protein [Bacilli bacterium]
MENIMKAKFLLYIIVGIFVIWSMDSININQIFKKNKIKQARLFYFFLTIAIVYLVTNFFYDFYNCFA